MQINEANSELNKSLQQRRIVGYGLYTESLCILSCVLVKKWRIACAWFWWGCWCSDIPGSSHCCYYPGGAIGLVLTNEPWEQENSASSRLRQGHCLPRCPNPGSHRFQILDTQVGNRLFQPCLEESAQESCRIENGFTPLQNKCLCVKALIFWG